MHFPPHDSRLMSISLRYLAICFGLNLLTVLSPVVTVGAEAEERTVSSPGFRSEVMAVLSKTGCNQGTCHGNAQGKGGFKLSLRGQDPDTDYVTLTRKLAARRVTPLTPTDSLLLQKPLMQIPHEGGRRFAVDSAEYHILLDWISAGMPADAADAPTLTDLQVSPSHKTIAAPERSVRLTATAGFSDGTQVDVTSLAIFESSALFVSVGSDGTAVSDQPGLTTITVRYLNRQVPVRLEFVPERSDFQFSAPAPANAIDQAVFAQLQRLKINPSPVCDDSTFLRRAYLDLTGLLPSAEEADRFLKSNEPDKRAALIDQLLASEAYCDQQTLRWADLLRAEEKTLDANGLKIYHDWIRANVAANRPLNEFAGELIAARGSTYKVPATNFYRALRKPEERAEAVAQVFLGVRLQCAKCHNHPFDHWTQDDYYGWSSFFARIDYEIIENKRRDKSDKHEFSGEQIVKIADKGEVKNPDSGKVIAPRFLGNSDFVMFTPDADGAAAADVAAETADSKDAAASTAASPSGTEETPQDAADKPAAPDRLQQLAAWLSDSRNKAFAITQANRIWAQLMGSGVIDPVDDFRATNPPLNPELLEVLRQEFVNSGFDVRHLMRLIMNSKCYQMSSTANDTNSGDSHCFARTQIRRLTAEQTLDGIAQVLDVGVPFGGHPEGTRAVQLVGVRNGEFRYSKPEVGDRFLALFGKPSRLQTCECERAGETTLAQTFEMLSGELLDDLLKKSGGRIDRLLAADMTDSEVIRQLYLSAVTRPPSPEETQVAVQHLQAHSSRRQALEDVVWALLNSNEFLLRQ